MKGKRCTKCGSLQPLYRFSADPTKADPNRLNTVCVDCVSEHHAEHKRTTHSDREWGRAHHVGGIGLIDRYDP